MECLAMNIPVISVDTGTARDYVSFKIERTVESIKKGIEMFYTAPKVQQFKCSEIAKQFKELYNKILEAK